MNIEFGLLGPLTVVRDGVVLPALSAKQRLLLAVLLVHANEVVTMDSLVDGLWGDDPPVTAIGVVQTYVSQLRKALEPGLAQGSSPRIVLRAEPGYRLVVDPDRLDANRFERLLDEGRAALRSGRPDVAARQLRDGLRLWRGQALADVADALAVRAEAQRLDDLRVLATEERIEADIALGRHGELVGELETFVAAHDLRERPWRQLMVCLYRSGRHVDALAAYQRLRRRLGDELGLDPGPELAKLERDILTHSPELTWSPLRTPSTTASVASSRTAPTSNLPSWSRPEVFVGRSAELAKLEEWWSQPDSAERMTLVVGESGIGKTRLVTVFASGLEAVGVPVFYGRALEAGGSAYEPVLGALRQLAVGSSYELIGHMSTTAAGALARLVPELADRHPDLATRAARWAEDDRSWLLAAVADCFDDLSTGTSLLVLDDMQWADRTALLLLSRLLAPGRSVRVLATSRPLGGVPGSPFADFLAEMRRDDCALRRIALAGLSQDDIADVLAVVGGDLSAADREFAKALHTRTNGHPLFVRECLIHLCSDALAGGGWPVSAAIDDLGIPDGVREIVGQRLAHLAPITRNVLRSAAVVGVEFDLDVVSAMSKLGFEPVLGAFEEAMAVGLLWEHSNHVDRYGFHHGMVQEVILDEMTASRRARLEWSAGEALEARHHDEFDTDAADIARHYAHGIAVGEPMRAVTWARRAGDQALRGMAYEDAMRSYETGLAALKVSTGDEDATRVDLLIALGRAADLAGDRARCHLACNEAASIARRAGDPHRVARAAVNLLGSLGPGRDPAVIALLAESAQALRSSPAEHDRQLLAELLARLSGYLVMSSPEESRRLAEEALQTARSTGGGRTLALALMYSTQTYALERPQLESRLHEAAGLAETSGDLELLLTAHSSLMVAGLTWADRDAFDNHLAEYAGVATTMRSPLPELLSLIDHAGAAALDGRYHDANAQLLIARQRSESIDDPFLTDNIMTAQLAVDRELGLLAGHEHRLRMSASRPWLQVMLAYVLCQSGNLEEARTEFDEAMTRPDALLAGFTRRRNLALLAEAAFQLRHTRAASALVEWLEPELRYGPCVTVGPNAFYGAVHRYLGLLAQTMGDAYKAVEVHRAALELHRSMRAAGWAARSQYDLGLALRARGEPGDGQQANDFLTQARSAADHLGMPKLLHEIDAFVPCP